MQQFFKITILLLFLGIFLIPKNFNAAPILKENCCNSSMAKHCSGDQQNHKMPCHSDDKKNGSKDCNDCNTCVSVAFFADLQKNTIIKDDLFILNLSQSISSYFTPEISDFTSNIWQPPKII